ncbi:ralBP1-associated Eps domain-containing protein 1-like isoform X3 [Lineus longissimus]|uniref:ralBP1-associated Eps domain-containing protein 1-like isoform X3 n=1 Tax=Lineus longissimus TaxID=88925 RepID=UPI00315C7EC4
MENLKLSDQELRFYAELFAACDSENSGRVPGVRASELFLTSGLHNEILFQIAEMCGAKRLGHFGRSQFYIALKLIAVAQCGLPLAFESFNLGIEIPLPKLTRISEDRRRGSQPVQYSVLNQPDQQGMISNVQQAGQLPPPPGKQHVRSFSGTRHAPMNVVTNEPVLSTNQNNSRGTPPHETRSPPFSPKDSPANSPGTQKRMASYVKQVSCPGQVIQTTGFVNSSYDGTGLKLEKGWASFEEEDSQGLITNDQKEWAHFSDHHKADTSSITSSEAESLDDIWTISDEQREYYVNQFKAMQPDLTGVIVGATAKEFFEKSKLPVHELSKIWTLSDVNKDGALSLEEFCTAMHLVVLRRNEIELPEKLPPSLMPYTPLVNSDEPFAADLPPGGTLKRLTPVSPQPNQWTTTFPPESPSSSAVSSPGTKPVSFDYKPVAQDPDSKIIHPVPMRMSPDGMPIPMGGSEFDRARTFSADLEDPSQEQYSQQEAVLSPTKQRSYTIDATDGEGHNKYAAPLHGRPRPTPKKAQSATGVSCEMPGQPLLLPPPASSVSHDDTIEYEPDEPVEPAEAERPSTLSLGAEALPAVPPRGRELSRSASCDFEKTATPEAGQGGQLAPPPAVPPRASPRDAVKRKLVGQYSEPGCIGSTLEHPTLADFRQFESVPETGAEYDMYQASGSKSLDSLDAASVLAGDQTSPNDVPRERYGSEEDILAEKVKSGRRVSSESKPSIQASIRQQRQRNTTLERLAGELNQELQEVMEQRIALEIQLEHLRPFSS